MTTANDAVEPVQVVRGNLLAAAAVSALVSDRVFGAHVEDPDAQTVDYPLVILDDEGGGDLRRFGRLQELVLKVWAYSRVSGDEAHAIYDACAQVLHVERLTLAGVDHVVVCQERGRPRGGWNESTRAHYVVGRWRLMAIW